MQDKAIKILSRLYKSPVGRQISLMFINEGIRTLFKAKRNINGSDSNRTK